MEMDVKMVPSYVSGNVPGEGGAPPAITAEELRQLLLEVLGVEEGADQDQELLPETTEESVSDNDAASYGVSDNDAAAYSVSGNSVSYNGVLTDIYTEVQTLQKEDLPIWEKPLADYTVTEGLLLIMLLLLLGIFASHFLRGGEKYV